MIHGEWKGGSVFEFTSEPMMDRTFQAGKFQKSAINCGTHILMVFAKVLITRVLAILSREKKMS